MLTVVHKCLMFGFYFTGSVEAINRVIPILLETIMLMRARLQAESSNLNKPLLKAT